MPSPLPILASLALGLCGLVGAPSVLGRSAVRVPWDASSPGDGSTGGGRLVRRPVDPGFRLAAARDPGIALPVAVALLASLSRWGRGQPSVCLEGAELAWALWRATGDPGALATGDDLLRTHLRRAPGGALEGVRAWLRSGDRGADPRTVFGSLPPALAGVAGSLVADTDPDAGWDLMLPAISDPTLPLHAVARTQRRAVLLARARRRPADAPVLRRVAGRADCPPDLRAEIEHALREIEGAR